VTALGGVPFVFSKAGVILGVHNRKFALGQRYVSCAVVLRRRWSPAGFEVAAAILRPNDEVFAFAALLVGAYQDGSIPGRGLLGITTTLTRLCFHNLHFPSPLIRDEGPLEIRNSNTEIRNKYEFSNYPIFQTFLVVRAVKFGTLFRGSYFTFCAFPLWAGS
jgi:hypothetical protein